MRSAAHSCHKDASLKRSVQERIHLVQAPESLTHMQAVWTGRRLPGLCLAEKRSPLAAPVPSASPRWLCVRASRSTGSLPGLPWRLKPLTGSGRS